MPSLEQTLTRSIWMRGSDDSTPRSLSFLTAERKQLISLLTRRPFKRGAGMADRILESKWLREHDDRIREETLQDIVAAVYRGELDIRVT